MVQAHIHPMTMRLRRLDHWGLALAALFVLLLPLWTGRLYAVDSVEYFAYLPSALLDHNLDFTNVYTYFDRLNPRAGIAGALLVEEKRDPVTHRPINVAPIGTAVLWSPGYLLTHALLKGLAAAGVHIRADGMSRPYTLTVSALSTLYGLAGLLLSYHIARRWIDPLPAALATAACLLATPVLFYTYISPPWSHAPALFMTALFIWYWLRIRPEPSFRHWLILGAIGGLMVLCREQLGLWLVLPAIDALSSDIGALRSRTYDRLGRLLAHQIAFVGVVALILVPQFLVYHALTGAYRPSPHVQGKLQAGWWSPHFFDTLVDPHHGAFVWTPIWLVGFIGLGWLWPRDRRVAVALVSGFLLQVYINGSFGTTWHLTASFGFRRLIEATPLFVLGVGLMLDRVRPYRRIAVAIGVLMVVWNFGLILQWSLPPRPIKDGLVWPGLVSRQIGVMHQVTGHLGQILFQRCQLVENGGC